MRFRPRSPSRVVARGLVSKASCAAMPEVPPSSAIGGAAPLESSERAFEETVERVVEEEEDVEGGSAIDARRQRYWAPAPATLWCVHGDITFLLSLETGRYHTLDDVAGAAWGQMCEGAALDAIARRIAADHGDSVDAREVLADLCALLGDLSRRGLIVPRAPQSTSQLTPQLTSQPASPCASPVVPQSASPAGALFAAPFTASSTPSPASTIPAIASGRGERPPAGTPAATARSFDAGTPALPSVAACLLRLTIVHLLMKCVGLRPLLRHVATRTAGPLRAPTLSFARALAGRVGTAMVWYPFGTACLEHSVCLLWMMRRAGREVDLRIGVQPFPFGAHAWVECRGEPINESPERVALFKPFPVIALERL